MLRATSAIVRPSSMTNSTALALYSSVKRRRVDPIAQPLPVGPAELHHCPLNRERSTGAIGSAAVGPLWSAGGWRAVTTVEIAVAVVGLTVWALGRHAALLDQPRRTHRTAV